MIRLINVSKKIKGREVLKDINVDFLEGKMYLLKGHNGCGKTMLLRMISGLISPTDGRVETEEKYDYGVLIENPVFLDNYSGLYNLTYLASIQKKISNVDIENMMKLFNLYDVKDDKVKKYSLGMKQRLGLIQAFMENQDVILLDEPFNALDEANMNIVFDYINNEKKKGKIIIVAAHALEQARVKEFDCVISMDNGRIVNVNE